ncbi:MAG: hypothetical protein E6Q98_08790 [Rhodospirillaceae bacterium]|nr:MAG: hypothetical protein E6Q98_08790 [Rhodospirillaceae bacterium]
MTQASADTADLRPGRSSLVAAGAVAAIIAIGVAYSAAHLIEDLSIALAGALFWVLRHVF